MKNIIVVAGATGNLGGKITDCLLAKGAEVRALVRKQTDPAKLSALNAKGVQICNFDTTNQAELSKHCEGAHCVVSALSGLDETILHTQKVLVEAAIQAGVKRFIPSDYSLDFTNLIEGRNRNLDLRKQF